MNTIKFYNPYNRLAGKSALFIGLSIMLLSALLGYFLDVHFNGNLQVTFFAKKGFLYSLMQHLIPWLIYSSIFFVLGFLSSKSKIRLVDVFGTFALSRLPLLIITLFGLFEIRHRVYEKVMMMVKEATGQMVDFKLTSGEVTFLVVFGLISLFMIIWQLALKFHAYRISCNLSGNRLILTYIVGILFSETLSRWLFMLFYKIEL